MARSKEELIELLKSNIKAFNNYRKEAKLDKIDFAGSDLSVANLCRADLSNSILRNCDLSFSYLHSANLSSADLTDLTLGRADMTEVNLSGAILDNANLSNTILYGANLTGASAKYIILEGSKIREANLSEADLFGSNLTNLDLSGVNFYKTNLKSANLTGTNLNNSINLNDALFDENTQWPTEDRLPKDFTLNSKQNFSNNYDDDYQINSDFGTGVTDKNENVEFLDFNFQHKFQEGLNTQNTVTEINYEKPKNIQEESSDLPYLDNFSELPNLDSFEEPINLSANHLQEEKIEEIFDLSVKEITENDTVHNISSISQQNFSVKPTEIASNMVPTMGISSYSDTYQEPLTTYDPHVNEKLDSIMTILSHLMDKVNIIESEQKDQREYINNINNNLQQEQKEYLSNFEQTIEQDHKSSIELIQKYKEEEREVLTKLFHSSLKNEQTTFFSTIKDLVNNNKIQDLVSEKVDFISNITKNNIDRLESKIDIIAQTDPLDQIDAMISELSTSIHSDQEDIELKINELTTISESIVSLLEMMSFNPQEQVDLTLVSSNIHQMLSNLESNIRQDQDKLDQKVDDLSVMIDNINHTIFNINSQIKNNEDNILLKSIQQDTHNITKDIFDINDISNNINTTLGALVEISNPKEILDKLKVYKSETSEHNLKIIDKLHEIQTNLSDNHSIFETIQQQQLSQSIEQYNKIQENLEKFQLFLTSAETNTNVLISNKQEETKKELKELSNKINSEIKSTNELVQNTLITEFIGINQKTEQIISNNDITNQKIQVLKQLLEDIFEKDSTANNNIIAYNQKIEYIKELINGDYETSKANFIQVNKKLEDIDNSIDRLANTSSIDDEMRSIFEHLLYISEKNNKSNKDSINYIIQKIEANEQSLQSSLNNLDKRISKVNSIVRNVYKSLDGITDIITGEASNNYKNSKFSSDSDFSSDDSVYTQKLAKNQDLLT